MFAARNLRKVLPTLLIFLSFGSTAPVFAEQQSPELNVTPVVIDEKGKPRDILKQTIKIINTSERKLNLYPSVNDVHKTDGEQEFVSPQNSDDRKDSLASWLELSRGVVELGPGEEKELPFVIRINVTAVVGSYHAVISFSEGSARASAEAAGALGEIMVNVEVQDDVKEIIQLNKFGTDGFFLSGDDVLFNYNLENIGNQELQPKGEIRIYNRKGEEVAAVPVNADGKTVSPDQMAQLASVWSAAQGFGRFKAFLTVDYGKVQTASVQDTVYFWVVPWKQLAMLSAVSVIMLLIFAFYFHRWFEERHLAKLAHAGFHVIRGEAHAGDAHSVPQGPGFFSSILLAVKSGAKRLVPRRKKKIPSVFPAEAIQQPPPPISAPIAPAPRPSQPAPSIAHEYTPPQYQSPQSAQSAQHTAGTINLKKLRANAVAPQQTPGTSHTINLKKPQ